MSQENLLEVKHLRTEFFSSKKSSVTAVDDVSFDIKKGEIVGLVGESGCGKSVTSLSIMQLLKDTPGKVTNGEIIFQGRNLLDASKASTDTDGSAHIAASTPFKEHLEFKQTVDPLARCDRDLALLRNPCHLIKVVRTDGILKEHRSVRLKPRAELYGKPRLQTAV